jgi:hypothetical protein
LEKSMLRIIQFWRKKLEKCYILGTLDQVWPFKSNNTLKKKTYFGAFLFKIW